MKDFNYDDSYEDIGDSYEDIDDSYEDIDDSFEDILEVCFDFDLEENYDFKIEDGDYDEDEEFNPSDEVREYQIKFEAMLERKEFYFMDIYQIEELYEFYRLNSQTNLCEELLDYAIKVYPDVPFFYEYRFNYLTNKDKYEEALAWIEYSIGYFGNNYSFLMLKGLALRNLERYGEAIDWYLYVVELNVEDRSEIYLKIAECHLELGNHDDSLHYYVLAFREKNPKVQSNICRDSKILDFSFAEKLLSQILEIDLFYAEAWYHLALLYYNQNKYKDALKAIDYAVALDEENMDYLIEKVHILIGLEQYEEALKLLFQIRLLDDYNSYILFAIGVCYHNLGLYDDGRRYFKKCINIDEEFIDAYHGLANCLYELKRYREAAIYCLTYLNYTFNFDICLRYIDIEIKLGNFTNALEYMQGISNDYYGEGLEIEFLLRKTYIEYLKGNEYINHILRENFYLECVDQELTAKLMFQSAALSFGLGSRNIGFFYLENALLKYPNYVDYLYDYNPDLKEDSEIKFLIENYKKE